MDKQNKYKFKQDMNNNYYNQPIQIILINE